MRRGSRGSRDIASVYANVHAVGETSESEADPRGMTWSHGKQPNHKSFLPLVRTHREHDVTEACALGENISRVLEVNEETLLRLLRYLNDGFGLRISTEAMRTSPPSVPRVRGAGCVLKMMEELNERVVRVDKLLGSLDTARLEEYRQDHERMQKRLKKTEKQCKDHDKLDKQLKEYQDEILDLKAELKEKNKVLIDFDDKLLSLRDLESKEIDLQSTAYSLDRKLKRKNDEVQAMKLAMQETEETHTKEVAKLKAAHAEEMKKMVDLRSTTNDDEIARLKENIEQIHKRNERQIEWMSEEHKRSEAIIVEAKVAAEQRMQESDTKAQGLQVKLVDLQVQLDTAQRKLASMETASKSEMEQLMGQESLGKMRLREQQRTLEQEKLRCQSERDSLESELSRVRRELSMRENESQRLRSECEEAQRECGAIRRTLGQQRDGRTYHNSSHLADLEARVAHAEARADAKEREVRRLLSEQQERARYSQGAASFANVYDTQPMMSKLHASAFDFGSHHVQGMRREVELRVGEIMDLKRKLEDSWAEQAKLKADKEHQDRDRHAAEIECKQMKDEIEAKESIISALKKEGAAMEEKASRECSEATAEANRLRKELTDGKEEIQKLKGKVDGASTVLEETVHQWKTKYMAVLAGIADMLKVENVDLLLLTRNEFLDTEWGTKRTDFMTLSEHEAMAKMHKDMRLLLLIRTKLKSFQAGDAAIKEESSKQKKQIENLEHEKKEQETALSDMMSAQTKLETRVERLRQRLEEERMVIEELENAVRTRDETITEMETKVESIDKEMEAKDKEVAVSKDALKKVKKQLDDARADNELVCTKQKAKQVQREIHMERLKGCIRVFDPAFKFRTEAEETRYISELESLPSPQQAFIGKLDDLQQKCKDLTDAKHALECEVARLSTGGKSACHPRGSHFLQSSSAGDVGMIKKLSAALDEQTQRYEDYREDATKKLENAEERVRSKKMALKTLKAEYERENNDAKRRAQNLFCVIKHVGLAMGVESSLLSDRCLLDGDIDADHITNAFVHKFKQLECEIQKVQDAKCRLERDIKNLDEGSSGDSTLLQEVRRESDDRFRLLKVYEKEIGRLKELAGTDDKTGGDKAKSRQISLLKKQVADLSHALASSHKSSVSARSKGMTPVLVRSLEKKLADCKQGNKDELSRRDAIIDSVREQVSEKNAAIINLESQLAVFKEIQRRSRIGAQSIGPAAEKSLTAAITHQLQTRLKQVDNANDLLRQRISALQDSLADHRRAAQPQSAGYSVAQSSSAAFRLSSSPSSSRRKSMTSMIGTDSDASEFDRY